LLSGAAYRVEELADLKLEAVAVAGQRLRRREDLRGGAAAAVGASVDRGKLGHAAEIAPLSHAPRASPLLVLMRSTKVTADRMPLPRCLAPNANELHTP
jgi:hypothetical protein